MMSLGRVTSVLLTLLLFGAAQPVMATQSPIETELDGAKTLYRQGRLEEAVTALQAVVTKLNQQRELQNRTTQLTDAYLHLGLAHLAMRNEAAAIEGFRQVVALDPKRTLDPEIYAPRVVALFEQARSEVVASRPAPEPTPAPVATGSAPITAPASGLSTRNLALLPGTKVRVQRAGDQLIEGRLIALNDEVLSLGDREWRVDVPRESVTRVDVVSRTRTRWLAGGLIGAGIGALAGAAEAPGCDGEVCYTRAENIAYMSLGMGLIGALIGAFIKKDEWMEFSLDSTPQAASVGTGGPAIVSFVWRY